MSLDSKLTEDRPIASIDELVEYFRSAERQSGPQLIGLEHEKLIYPIGGSNPVPYEGERGIGALMQSFSRQLFEEHREAPGLPVIAMTRGRTALSLEPGGQFELSGAPWASAREAHRENLEHLADLKSNAAALGLRVVTLGYRPFDSILQMPWMPKTRYRVMRESLGQRGRLAHAMMLMTATGQVSLDWKDEADCARKVTASARLAPVLVALYANSPLVEGAPSGFLSWRSRVWNEVDSSRCGYLPAMFDGSFSYRAYTEWALDAPVLFLRREGKYLNPKIDFRGLLKNGFEGRPAQYGDWVDHLSTLFPEVRIKKVLEIRSADGVNAELTGALAALMRGLLYDSVALGELEAALPRLSLGQHLNLHALAQREGLEGIFEKRPLAALAKEVVEIADRGLRRLDPADASLLQPLFAQADSGKSPARWVLEGSRQPSALLDRFTV
jgi:glutamate--cysteine ligase